jgi:hypothetical protein
MPSDEKSNFLIGPLHASAERAVFYAEELALSLGGQSAIGTEHVLFGIAKELQHASQPYPLAGISLPALLDRIEERDWPLGQSSPEVRLSFTDQAIETLCNASSKAIEFGDACVGIGHLILGLLDVTGCGALRILEEVNVDVQLLCDRWTEQLETDSPFLDS